MSCFIRPVTVIVLCLCTFTLIITTQAQDLCDVYDSSFQCESDSPRRSFLKDDQDCGSSLVETTIKLLAEGDRVIQEQLNKFGARQDAVIIIGLTGTGKSTLTYFVAGNNSALLSVRNDVGVKQIKDCNGKISDSLVVTKTTFPELVIDPTTSTAIFDYPGFLNTRPVCAEISNAYFMLAVARILPNVKVGIVVEHNAVNGQNKGTFLQTLENVINFIPNIEFYSGGIGLFATKVDFSRYYDDTEAAGFIQEYLSLVRVTLDQIYTGDKLRKAKFIVDELLVSGRVGPFRTPEECGPLSDMPYMQSNKATLSKVIDNIMYVKTGPNDFSMSLSTRAQIELPYIGQYLENIITDSLFLLSVAVQNLLTFDCAELGDCSKISGSLVAFFSDVVFLNGYKNFDTWVNSSLNTVVMNITSVYFDIPGIYLPPNVYATLDTNSKYIDFLGTLGNFTVDIPAIFKPLQDITKHVAKGISNFSLAPGSPNEILYNKLARLCMETLFLEQNVRKLVL